MRFFFVPVSCQEFLQWWRRQFPWRESLRLHRRAQARREFSVRAKWFCGCARRSLFGLAARSNRARSVRARANRPRRGRWRRDFFLRFVLRPASLFFQIARPAFQGDFFGRFLPGFHWWRFFFQQGADPFTELEIGQEEQADQAQRGINNGRADRAEQRKTEITILASGRKSASRASRRCFARRWFHEIFRAGRHCPRGKAGR